MLTIAIPTHNRVSRQPTLESLPRELLEAVVLVTSTESEAAALRASQKARLVAKQVVCAGAAGGAIATKRQWIADKFGVRNPFIMLDDDMTPFARCAPRHRAYVDGRWKAHPGHPTMARDLATDSAVVREFAKIEEILAHKTVVHAGFSSRMGNDTEEREEKIGPQRMMHALGYAAGVLKPSKIRFDAVSCREDFHVTLELLKRGLPSYVVYRMCFSPGSYGAPGGCSTERTTEASDNAAELLARLHAPFVKVVQKEYKNVPRKEVIVQWKRAYESSKT
jgi:hypothetical protein